jgi:hypothetical protein
MSIKKSLTAAFIAAGFICQAASPNVVYFTGSTAFRSTYYNQLSTAGLVFDSSPAVTRATRGGSLSGASYMLFYGNIGGTPTYIDCYWNGSEAGIACAANVTVLNDGLPLAGNPATWLKADSSVTMNDQTAAPGAGELESSSHGADLAAADTSQAVSLTPYVANTSTALKDYGVVGIIAFAWVKNVNSAPNAAWSNLKNITTFQMQSLFASPQHAAFLTGVATDTNYVYMVGRNKGSGTRVNVMADSQYGINTAVNQFSIGGGVSTPTTGTLTLVSEGDNGYESGGGVAAALGIDGSCGQTDPNYGYPGWIAVGYLSASDAIKSGLTVANNWLTENGVAESDGTVIEGQYTYWGNEHLFGKHNIGGYQDTIGTKIATAMQTTLNGTTPVLANHDPAIGTAWMHCTKVSDTAFPTHN